MNTYRESNLISYGPLGPLASIKANAKIHKKGIIIGVTISTIILFGIVFPKIVSLVITFSILGSPLILILYMIYSLIVDFTINFTSDPDPNFKKEKEDRYFRLSKKTRTVFYYIFYTDKI